MKRHRILVLDSKNINPNRYLAVALCRAFAADANVDVVMMATYRDVFEIAEALRPTLTLVFGGEEIDDFILLKLKRICSRIAIWFTEDPYENSQNVRTSELVDFVFTNDLESVRLYKRGRYLPLAAFEPFHFRQIEPEKRRYDLFFAGTAWPNRVKMLGGLLRKQNNLRFKLVIPSKVRVKLGSRICENFSQLDDHVSGLDFSRFCSRSGGTLYLTRDYSASPGAREMTTSPGPRFFEAAFAGGVQLYEKGTVDLPMGFTDGENAFSFETLDQLMTLVERLKDTNVWETMAKASQRAVMANHTYGHRVSTILESFE